MINAQDRLALGLWALDFIETASKGPWRRFAKFGRAGIAGEAYYVISGEWVRPGLQTAKPDDLWVSTIRETEPLAFVGNSVNFFPIFEQFWQAGWKAHLLSLSNDPNAFAAAKVSARIAARKIDPDAALDELIGGSDGKE